MSIAAAVAPASAPSIHLQAVGSVRAKRADELQVGDITIWNFGLRARVEAVREVSKCYVEADLRSEESGNVNARRMKKDRLVGFSTRPWSK